MADETWHHHLPHYLADGSIAKLRLQRIWRGRHLCLLRSHCHPNRHSCIPLPVRSLGHPAAEHGHNPRRCFHAASLIKAAAPAALSKAAHGKGKEHACAAAGKGGDAPKVMPPEDRFERVTVEAESCNSLYLTLHPASLFLHPFQALNYLLADNRG